MDDTSAQRDLGVRTEILLELKALRRVLRGCVAMVLLRVMTMMDARMKMGMRKCLGKWIWMILRLMGCRGSKSSPARQKMWQVPLSFPTKKDPALWAAAPFLSRE